MNRFLRQAFPLRLPGRSTMSAAVAIADSLRNHLIADSPEGAGIRVLETPGRETFDPPRCLAGRESSELVTRCARNRAVPMPPWELYRVPEACILGMDPVLVDERQERLFLDNSTASRLLDKIRRKAPRRYTRHRLPGSSLLAFNKRARKNYYHWMLETLPRMFAMDYIDEPLRVLVSEKAPPFVFESLEMLGVPGPNRTVQVLSDELYKCETLYYSSERHEWGVIPRAAALAVRDRLRAAAGETGRGNFPARIYISRRGSRRRPIHNEEELSTKLERLGIQTVTPESYSLGDQIRLFSGAELVVGAHGAGLSNILFCQPGTRVVEILTSGPPFWHFCYLAQQMELDWRYIVAETVPGQDVIDVDVLVQRMSAAGIRGL